METFHLLHLANSWPRRRQKQNESVQPSHSSQTGEEGEEAAVTNTAAAPPPPTNTVAETHVLSNTDTGFTSASGPITSGDEDGPRIRAAAVQMIFAERYSRVFISPDEVEALQNAAATGLLETLARWK
jgi:uridine phosphorylase